MAEVTINIKTKTVYLYSVAFSLGSVQQTYSFESDIAFDAEQIIKHITSKVKAAVHYDDGLVIMFYEAIPDNLGVLTRIFNARIDKDTREEIKALFAGETQIEGDKARSLFTLLLRKGHIQ